MKINNLISDGAYNVKYKKNMILKLPYQIILPFHGINFVITYELETNIFLQLYFPSLSVFKYVKTGRGYMGGSSITDFLLQGVG